MLLNKKMKYKGIKSYGIPEADPDHIFVIMKDILYSNSFSLLEEKLARTEQRYIGWFRARFQSLDKEGEFIVIVQVLNNKMEFIGFCDDKHALISGLTSLVNDFLNSLKAKKIVQNEMELIELYCRNCGGTLQKFPKPGEVYTCKLCEAKMQF
ncbi:MAG: hypothetical protein ACTSXU_05720 [Promethearchaeota archaeon]